MTSAPPAETGASTQPPATQPPATQPPASEAPGTASPPADTTAGATPPDDDDSGTVWWPWLLAAAVVIGAIVAFAASAAWARLGRAGDDRVLDGLDQVSTHLAGLPPDAVAPVAVTYAGTLATLRSTVARLTEAAPDVDRRGLLNSLTMPLAELHSAVDAVALSPYTAATHGRPSVAQRAPPRCTPRPRRCAQRSRLAVGRSTPQCGSLADAPGRRRDLRPC